MKIPIIKGIYSDTNANFRQGYPVNLIPVALETGISGSYLRPGFGIRKLGTATTPGPDRGSINWKNTCYRVFGSKFCSVDASGEITVIGDVGGTDDTVSLDYSFDYLAIVSNFRFFLFNGVSLVEVIDLDLGKVETVKFIDGYFTLTDGEYIITTDIDNPFSITPEKYGSSELDPDRVNGQEKIRGELYIINRHTIEAFRNVGGDAFPFQRIEGSSIDRGAIGLHAHCVFVGSIAFLGSGRNESPGIYVGLNGESIKLSSVEIDTILKEYTEEELSTAYLCWMIEKNNNMLLCYLPDKTLIYNHDISKATNSQTWSILTSSISGFAKYQASYPCWCYDRWIVSNDSCCVGELTDEISTHWDEKIYWQFMTPIIYADSSGAILHDIEIISNKGNIALGLNPVVWTSYSNDGILWSNEDSISIGTTGDRYKRLKWFQQGYFSHWRIQKFRGTSDAHLSISAVEATLEGLIY